MSSWIDAALCLAAVAVALALRPWRLRGALPWPALLWWALLPLSWSADVLTGTPMLQPLSGACLLVLMVGWPLAVLLLVPAAWLAGAATGLPPLEALHRLAWLGIVPATLALGLGLALRRWLPNHLFIYILGRGFFATALAVAAAGAVSAVMEGAPSGLALQDLWLARALAAWGDAFLTGMFAAIFVAFRPQWLATYADRIYLPKDG